MAKRWRRSRLWKAPFEMSASSINCIMGLSFAAQANLHELKRGNQGHNEVTSITAMKLHICIGKSDHQTCR